MQPQNHVPLFPTMATLPQSGKTKPIVFAPNTAASNAHALSPGMRRVLKIDTPRTAEPAAPGSTRQLFESLLAKNSEPLSFDPVSSAESGTISLSSQIRRLLGVDKPHEPTLVAFKELAALGTLPPSIDEISPTVLAPIPGVDDAVRNVSALTGQACAEIMQYRYMPAQETAAPSAPSFTY